MPAPGVPNNAQGINAFSGPMGEKEPAYGAVERAKVLTRLAPVGSPPARGAPERSKRRAIRGGDGPAAAAPSAPPMLPPPQQQPDLQVEFWQEVLSDPESSPLTRQYAQAALGLPA